MRRAAAVSVTVGGITGNAAAARQLMLAAPTSSWALPSWPARCYLERVLGQGLSG